VLSAVPGREWLRAAVARSRRYAQLSPPIPAGPNGREFLWQAAASDEKLKFMLRRGKDAPLEAVLDPNTWASDEQSGGFAEQPAQLRDRHRLRLMDLPRARAYFSDTWSAIRPSAGSAW
jgi:hypothetical protein